MPVAKQLIRNTQQWSNLEVVLSTWYNKKQQVAVGRVGGWFEMAARLGVSQLEQ
jgi:hypothetical protein